jgi:hypothetical protein
MKVMTKLFCAMISGCAAYAQIPVGCGDVLTVSSQEYILTGDMNCSVDPAIHITGNSVRFNLRGFKITGYGGTGVLVGFRGQGNLPLSGVSILNGGLSGFAFGIEMHASTSYVRNMTVSGALGVRASFGSDNVFTRLTLNNAGLYLQAVDRSIVVDSTLNGGDLNISSGDANAILSTNILGGTANDVGTHTIVQDCKVHGGGLTLQGKAGTIRNNTLTSNRTFGLDAGSFASGYTIEDNTFGDNGVFDVFEAVDRSHPAACANTWMFNRFKISNKSCIR